MDVGREIEEIDCGVALTARRRPVDDPDARDVWFGETLQDEVTGGLFMGRQEPERTRSGAPRGAVAVLRRRKARATEAAGHASPGERGPFKLHAAVSRFAV